MAQRWSEETFRLFKLSNAPLQEEGCEVFVDVELLRKRLEVVGIWNVPQLPSFFHSGKLENMGEKARGWLNDIVQIFFSYIVVLVPVFIVFVLHTIIIIALSEYDEMNGLQPSGKKGRLGEGKVRKSDDFGAFEEYRRCFTGHNKAKVLCKHTKFSQKGCVIRRYEYVIQMKLLFIIVVIVGLYLSHLDILAGNSL
jgi:hypothetical protein